MCSPADAINIRYMGMRNLGFIFFGWVFSSESISNSSKTEGRADYLSDCLFEDVFREGNTTGEFSILFPQFIS